MFAQRRPFRRLLFMDMFVVLRVLAVVFIKLDERNDLEVEVWGAQI